jgi:hypothetical protein
MSEMPARPKKRGKTAEQYAADVASYNLAMREHFRALAEARRERFIDAGIKRYEWLAMDVHGCCAVAAKNNGQIFSVSDGPPEGHPCEGECGSPDWCRCTPIPVVEFSGS